jgi:hypothetical protein
LLVRLAVGVFASEQKTAGSFRLYFISARQVRFCATLDFYFLSAPMSGVCRGLTIPTGWEQTRQWLSQSGQGCQTPKHPQNCLQK